MNKKIKYEIHFKDTVEPNENKLFFYNYNFFYICLAISHIYSDQKTIKEGTTQDFGIRMSSKKLAYFIEASSKCSRKKLEKLLNKSFCCLRASLYENIDKTNLESLDRMKALVNSATDIYNKTLAILG